MKKLHIPNIFIKEKELALSLLRIPLNFFSEDKTKSQSVENTPKQDDLKLNAHSTSQSTDGEVKLDENTNTAQFNISKEIPGKSTSTYKASTNSSADDSTVPNTESQNQPSEKNVKDENNNTQTTQNNKTPTDASTSPTNTTQPVQESSSASPSSGQTLTPPPPPKMQSQTNSAQPKKSNSPTSSSATSKPITPTNNNENHDSKPTSSQNDKPQKNDDNTTPDDNNTQSSNPQKTNSHDSKKSTKKGDTEADRLKDKFGKKIPGSDRAKKLKDDAKKKLADKVAKNPAASKALGATSKAAGAVGSIPGALDDANKIKDAIKDGDTSKMHEAVGDLAVKAASTAGDAVFPGAGKAIGAVDKVVGQTEVGKKAKKAIGCCCCSSCGIGCMIPVLIVLIPIMIISQAFSWITNLFGGKDKADLYGDELSEQDFKYIQDASLEYSMQEYTDLTTNLNNPGWLKKMFGLDPEYPIQEATEEFINNRYTYSAKQADKHNNNPNYKDLIKEGYIIKVEEGDFTSFGMAFEILKENYSVFKLKAPSSAPKRIKMVNGEKVIYTTYDPKGIHVALFQDVLTNMDGLKVRFMDQVNEEWFNELNNILDEKFEVYIESLDETRTLSLRDLFIETSLHNYDTEYYSQLVNKALLDTIHNNEIITQYDELVKRLAMLELMTYMLAYQKYYIQIENFVSDYSHFSNIEMFDPKGQGEDFWAQFLTFTNVEHYLALSSLTEPSLAYEIAIASISTSINAMEVSKIEKGGKSFIGIRKLVNWYATYEFSPQVTLTQDGFTYTLAEPKCTPTQEQIRIFDKYNVGFGLFDNSTNYDLETISLKNQNAFFAIFETATGIKISIIDDDGNPQTPIYKSDKTGRTFSRTFPVDTSNGTQARITNGYNQTYSDATVARFGLSHNNHTGIDYGVPSGTTVKATDSGIAYITRGNTGYGNYVKIIHDDGYTSIYAHGNGTFYINNGSRVVAGQPIMQSGNSGNSTGPHLHFEVRSPSGSTINPTSYLYGNA